MKVVAGIDVGKCEWVVAVAGAPVRCFSNHARDLKALRSWLRAQAVTPVVSQTTGTLRGVDPEVV